MTAGQLASTPAPARPDLSVVVLNYNTREHLRACLESLRGEGSTSLSQPPGPLRAEVIVVDNASPDGSADMVARAFPWARLVRAPRNGGFAYGNNLALPDAAGQAILLLNPDTSLPLGALGGLYAALQAHPEAGVVGPKLLRADGTLHRACRRSFPTPQVSLFRLSGLARLFPGSPLLGRYNLSHLDEDQPAEVDAVCVACLLVRRQAIAQVGLLDERFFMYAEDIDWCLRIARAGWTVRYEPGVAVHHQHGAAARGRRLATTFHFYRAMDLFYRKHYARQYNPAVGVAVTVGVYAGMALAFARLALPSRSARRAGSRPVALP